MFVQIDIVFWIGANYEQGTIGSTYKKEKTATDQQHQGAEL